ncbi:hypothetical protein ACWGTO_25140 [Mesorhizobium sp. PL10]
MRDGAAIGIRDFRRQHVAIAARIGGRYGHAARPERGNDLVARHAAGRGDLVDALAAGDVVDDGAGSRRFRGVVFGLVSLKFHRRQRGCREIRPHIDRRRYRRAVAGCAGAGVHSRRCRSSDRRRLKGTQLRVDLRQFLAGLRCPVTLAHPVGEPDLLPELRRLRLQPRYLLGVCRGIDLLRLDGRLVERYRANHLDDLRKSLLPAA